MISWVGKVISSLKSGGWRPSKWVAAKSYQQVKPKFRKEAFGLGNWKHRVAMKTPCGCCCRSEKKENIEMWEKKHLLGCLRTIKGEIDTGCQGSASCRNQIQRMKNHHYKTTKWPPLHGFFRASTVDDDSDCCEIFLGGWGGVGCWILHTLGGHHAWLLGIRRARRELPKHAPISQKANQNL